MKYEELMAEVGKRLELEAFEPDEDGMCMLIGEGVIIFFHHVPEADMVLTTSILRTLDEEPSKEYLCGLLEANLMWQRTRGATVSLDASERNVMLARYDRLSTIDADTFMSVITDFTATVLEWGEREPTEPLPDMPEGLSPESGMIRL